MDYPIVVATLDIGGTKIAGALVNYEAENRIPSIQHVETRPTEADRGGGPVLATVCDEAHALLEEARARRLVVRGIGVSTAGRVDAETGSIAYANDIMPDWAGQPLAERLRETCDLPVTALNDVQAHALGEGRWGAARGSKTCLMVAAGTGLGGAIITNGRLLRGRHGFAGEIGHMPCCQAAGIKCVCGGTGHLESVAAGSGIEDRYAELSGERKTGAEIAKLAREGDVQARRVIMKAGLALGEAIAGLTNALDPDCVVLGGSVTKAGSAWRAAVQEGFERQIPDVQRGLPIVPADLGGYAPLIGAAEELLDTIGRD